MKPVLNGLAWAAVILLAAFAGSEGLISRDLAKTLAIVLPVLAVLSLQGNSACGLSRIFSRKSSR